MNKKETNNSEYKLEGEGDYLISKNIFHEIKQPKLNSESRLEQPFHKTLTQRKSDLKKIFGSTGIEYKIDLLKYIQRNNRHLNQSPNSKKNKNYIDKNKRLIIPLIKEYNEKDFKIKSRNNNKIFNHTNTNSFFQYSNSNYDNSNKTFRKYIKKTPFMDYKKFSHYKTYEQKQFLLNNLQYEKNYSNINSSPSKTLNNKDIKIILGRKKTKKFIDFDTINLTTSSQRETKQSKSLEKTSTINLPDEKSITVYINTDYEMKDTISLSKEIQNLSNRNVKISKRLNNILRDKHYFPILSNSFKDDIYDIVSKKFIIKRPGCYKFKNFKTDNENFNKILENYWIEKKPDKGVIALVKKNQKIKTNIYSKLYYDMKKAEKLKLELKFGKNLGFFNKLFQEPKKKKFTRPKI